MGKSIRCCDVRVSRVHTVGIPKASSATPRIPTIPFLLFPQLPSLYLAKFCCPSFVKFKKALLSQAHKALRCDTPETFTHLTTDSSRC